MIRADHILHIDLVEEWRPVVGFEGSYEVSDRGRVRGLDRADNRGRRTPGTILRPGKASNGYLTVCLQDAGHRRSVPVQHLVAEAFIGPRPIGFQVCHNDGCRTNNRLGNLRYDTPRGNNADRVKHGTVKRGLDNRGKLTPEQVRAIRAAHKRIPQSALAAAYGVSPACIQAVHDGRTYKHV